MHIPTFGEVFGAWALHPARTLPVVYGPATSPRTPGRFLAIQAWENPGKQYDPDYASVYVLSYRVLLNVSQLYINGISLTDLEGVSIHPNDPVELDPTGLNFGPAMAWVKTTRPFSGDLSFDAESDLYNPVDVIHDILQRYANFFRFSGVNAWTRSIYDYFGVKANLELLNSLNTLHFLIQAGEWFGLDIFFTPKKELVLKQNLITERSHDVYRPEMEKGELEEPPAFLVDGENLANHIHLFVNYSWFRNHPFYQVSRKDYASIGVYGEVEKTVEMKGLWVAEPLAQAFAQSLLDLSRGTKTHLKFLNLPHLSLAPGDVFQYNHSYYKTRKIQVDLQKQRMQVEGILIADSHIQDIQPLRVDARVDIAPFIPCTGGQQGPLSIHPSDTVYFGVCVVGGSGSYTLDWDFGDGSPHASGTTTSHLYAKNGRYITTCTVTDSITGQVVRDEVVIRVLTDLVVWGLMERCRDPKNRLKTSQSDYVNPPFANFYAEGWGDDITVFEWEWNDGSPNSEGETVRHTYFPKGVPYTLYQPKLRAYRGPEYAEDLDMAFVVHEPWMMNGRMMRTMVSDSITGPWLPCTQRKHLWYGVLPKTLYFNAYVENMTSPAFDWDFGDETPHGTLQLVSHTYTSPGNYLVTLTITDGGFTIRDYIRVMVFEPLVFQTQLSLDGAAWIDFPTTQKVPRGQPVYLRVDSLSGGEAPYVPQLRINGAPYAFGHAFTLKFGSSGSHLLSFELSDRHGAKTRVNSSGSAQSATLLVE